MTGDALLGVVMLVVLLGVIFVGFPISFTMLFLAFVFGYVGFGMTVFDLAYFQTIGLMKEELLAAVPLFVLMGFITEQAGMMERLFRAFRDLLAPIRGSLFAVVILTSAVFAMATGIVGAAVTVLGIMASPIMNKSGYDAKLSGKPAGMVFFRNTSSARSPIPRVPHPVRSDRPFPRHSRSELVSVPLDR